MRTRQSEPELMDREGHDPDELGQSLRQVAQVNRWLGGIGGYKRALRAFLAPGPDSGRGGVGGGCAVEGEEAPLRLLDVGTGNAELPLHLLEWSRTRGSRWKAVGVDRHPQITAIAAGRAAAARERLAVVRADALHLPFRDRSFDIALCTLTLHHFDDAAATRIVREMARVAVDSVFVSDLERSRLALLGARLLAGTLWRRNRITRHDGPVSVRRSFTRAELLRIGERAGLADVSVHRRFPFRLLLTGAPPRPASR